MSTQLTAESAKQSLTAHVQSKGAEVFSKYGPNLGMDELDALLKDRSCVRYPCTLDFDESRLQPGEFAFAEPKGEQPEDGFTLHIHPAYCARPGVIPHLALYHLVTVNYGEFASPDDAEVFASSALGLDRELYYRTLCDLADELPDQGTEPEGHHPGCTCGG